MKFKIEYRKRKMPQGFIGLNYFAAKSHGIPFHHKHHTTIEVYSKVPKSTKHATEKHEEIEYLMMRKGFGYHKAHKIALKYERDKRRAKTILKEIKQRKGGK